MPYAFLATHLVLIIAATVCLANVTFKRPKAPSFQMDQDEIWQECSTLIVSHIFVGTCESAVCVRIESQIESGTAIQIRIE